MRRLRLFWPQLQTFACIQASNSFCSLSHSASLFHCKRSVTIVSFGARQYMSLRCHTHSSQIFGHKHNTNVWFVTCRQLSLLYLVYDQILAGRNLAESGCNFLYGKESCSKASRASFLTRKILSYVGPQII